LESAGIRNKDLGIRNKELGIRGGFFLDGDFASWGEGDRG
jgi:hypothetical protein